VDKKIRLVHITTVPDTFHFLRGQIGFFKARGFDVVGISSPGPLQQLVIDREQISFHSVRMHRRVTPFRDLGAVWRLYRLLKRIRPHIVHSHTPKAGLLGMISAWLAHVPVRIYHMRGLPMTTATGFKRRMLNATERIACKLAQRVLCVSNSIREIAIGEDLCPAGKIKMLASGSSNGVDSMERFNPDRIAKSEVQRLRSEFGIGGSDSVIGYVGRIVRDKGLVELAEAWRRLRDKFPKLHLVIVGYFEPQDPLPSDIKQFLSSDPKVHITGFVDDTAPYYKLMSMLVLPSYREGFPNAPLEASAMGLPVIATQVPGCVDAVSDGKTGTLVPAKDSGQLAWAVERYLNDIELRRDHGKEGRERVLCEFRRESIWEGMYQTYTSMLQAKGIALPILGKQ